MELSSPLVLGLGFAQGSSSSPGSIKGDVFTKGMSGKPAALPGAQIVRRGPVTGETESDAQGALTIDGLRPATYQVEVNAPSFYAALAVEVSVVTSSTIPAQMNVDAVTNATLPRLTQLKAMDCAFRRMVHHV